MIIVDTSVWVDFFAANENLQSIWLRRELGSGQPFAMTDLILCEILQGLRSEKSFAKISQQLAEFPVFNSGGQELAIASARNYRFLRSRGITVRKTIDCVIATYCISAGHTLLHRDRDFDPFEEYLGLRVIHPQMH
jgi:predicted nucleic acid-binding protein